MADTPAIVTLTTDFGGQSRYVAAMKGVLLSINPRLTVVDITHAVPPQDVRQGAYVLAETTRWFPAGSIHVAVIDPGVGTDRSVLYAEIDSRHYIAPDNGLLTCLAEETKPTSMRVVNNRTLWPETISRTFHGRDIMAPVAAHLSLGLDVAELGPACSDFVQLPLPKAERVGQKIEGEVIEVDSFGNLVTSITADMLAEVPRDESVTIRCDGHETFGIFGTYGDQPPMTLIALVGSGDRLELAIVDDSAKVMLGVGVGAPVTVEW